MNRKFCLFFIICVCSFPNTFSLSFNDDEPPEELALKIAGAMTDEEALAQLFMFGWKEWERGPEPAITEWVAKRTLGGVKVFGWNTGNTDRLAATIGGFQKQALQNRFNIPLLVATDQEGGLVRHVKGETSAAPGAMAIGASGYPRDAYLSGYYTGTELAALGINMNFAPSVDLYTNHDSLLIGTRSFGDDPVHAGILGIAFAKGEQAAGVIPTAKHFPGHGDTELDSHGVLPEINAPFETLWERELLPYRMLAKDGIPAIMSGHIAFPATEAGRLPASLSPWFLQTVLREKIGFGGLIVTDDLTMNGATMGAGSLSGTAKAAILAGNDIIMMGRTPALDEAVWTSLLKDMAADKEFHARVRESAVRVLTVKLRFLKGENAVPFIPDPAALNTSLPNKDAAAFFQVLAARAVTVVKDGGAVLPLSAAKAGKVLLAGQNLDFFDLGKAAFDGASAYWYNAPVNADLMRRAAAADTIVVYLSNEEGVAVLKAFRSLRKRVIVLSVLSPVYLKQVPWVDAAIAVYSESKESLAAGFSVISGSLKAEGKLPFRFD